MWLIDEYIVDCFSYTLEYISYILHSVAKLVLNLEHDYLLIIAYFMGFSKFIV